MFDTLEARLNRVALAKLANATAKFREVEVPVIFDASFVQGRVGPAGMSADSPQMVMSSAEVPQDFIDEVVIINGTTWQVADRHPDGETDHGLTIIPLVKP